MSHSHVEIYTTPTCPDCATLKRWLTAQGVPFIERDLTNPPHRRRCAPPDWTAHRADHHCRRQGSLGHGSRAAASAAEASGYGPRIL